MRPQGRAGRLPDGRTARLVCLTDWSGIQSWVSKPEARPARGPPARRQSRGGACLCPCQGVAPVGGCSAVFCVRSRVNKMVCTVWAASAPCIRLECRPASSRRWLCRRRAQHASAAKTQSERGGQRHHQHSKLAISHKQSSKSRNRRPRGELQQRTAQLGRPPATLSTRRPKSRPRGTHPRAA